MVWSTIVDSPITSWMTPEGLEEWLRARWGEAGLKDLPERIERAKKNGTSLLPELSLKDLVAGNRAGEKERELTFEEIISYELVPMRKPIIRKRISSDLVKPDSKQVQQFISWIRGEGNLHICTLSRSGEPLSFPTAENILEKYLSYCSKNSEMSKS